VVVGNPQRLTKSERGASSGRGQLLEVRVFAFVTRIFAGVRIVRMSSGKLALIRDLGLVKGGKGLRHHERLTLVGIVRSFAASRADEGHSEERSHDSPDLDEPKTMAGLNPEPIRSWPSLDGDGAIVLSRRRAVQP
jgi:hypothetical protein